MGFVPPSILFSWPWPNYVNPETKSTTTYFIITTFFLFFATTALSARMYARLIIRRWFGLDDICICLAYTATLGVFIAASLGTAKYEWNRHLYDTTPDVVKPSIQLLWAASILWAFSSTFTRLSLLCFYYRLLDHIPIRRYRSVLHIVVVCHVSFLIAYIIALTLTCVPVDSWWVRPEIPSRCVDIGKFFVTIASTNTFLEFLVAILPIPVIFNLQMEKRQRWSVISLLCLGFLVTIVGCVRTFYIWKAFLKTYDTSWWSEEHWLCSEVENDVALMCACAPALRPLIGRLLGYRTDRKTNPVDTNSVPASKSSFASTRARGKASTFPSMNSTLVWFDLEGIADDGMGYSVSITAGRDGHSARGKLRKERASPETNRRSAVSSVRRSMSRAGRSEKAEQSKVPERPRRIQIVTRRSVEIRESYQAPENNSTEEIQIFKTMSEKDMDIERTAAGLADWSLLSSPPAAMTRSGAALGNNKGQGVKEGQDLPGILEQSGRTSQMSQASQQPRQTSSPVAWLQPPSHRVYSPVTVTRPLNSSQWWASPQPRRSVNSMISEDEVWMHEMLTISGERSGEYSEGSMLARDGSQETLSTMRP